MKLFEVVRGAKSSPETLVTAMALGKQIGKIPAMAGNTDGFVANRSRAPFNAEMVILLEEGCLPEQVDKVMVDFGYPMGPFAVGDLAGLDIGAAGRRRRAAENPNYRKLPIADKLVELGRYGQKTGAGWYKLRKRRSHPASGPRGRGDHRTGRRRTRRAAKDLHRHRNSASVVVLFRERGVPHPGGRQGLPRQRYRRDVAARLRLPALSRWADVLG